MTPDDAARVVERYAAAVRACYCEERNRWHLRHERKHTAWGATPIPRYDGGTDNQGRAFPNVWLKVARFVIANRMDPRRFVRAQFATRDSKPIEPTQLATATAAGLYEFQGHKDHEEILRLFDFQRQQALVEFDKLRPCRKRYGWTDRQITEAVLGNALVPLSALFRYCLAQRDGLDALAEAFAEEALVQYVAQPADYDRVWAGWIPAELREAAARLTEHVAAPDAARPGPDRPPPGRRLPLRMD